MRSSLAALSGHRCRWRRARAPGAAPLPGSRARRARRRGPSTRARTPSRSLRRARQAAGAALEGERRAGCRPHLEPRQAGHAHLGARVQDELAPRPRRARARPRSVPWRVVIAPGLQPRREHSQPSSSRPATSEPSRICTVDRRDRAELRPPSGRVERRRDALAPRRRAQPGEVDDVRAQRPARRRGPARRAGPGRRRSPAARPARARAARRRPPDARAAPRRPSGRR